MSSEIGYSFINPHTGKPLIKHWNFFTNLLLAAEGTIDKQFFYFGGGANSGKSYTILLAILYIAQKYPHCKIHIIRQSLPTIISTTVESAKKLFGTSGRWYADKSNYRFIFNNGSVVYFFSENFDSDKDLNRFKGLETNICVFEEIQECQQKTFQKAIERTGRWKYGNLTMPKPLVCASFNPTHIKWVRDLVYIPYKSENIPDNTYIQFATSADNPFITREELAMYQNLDSLHYKQYIEGSWEVFENIKAFCYAFDGTKHITDVKQRSEDMYISFDFNVNPMTAILFHKGSDFLHIFKEFRLENSNVYVLCEEINKCRNGRRVFITGDASGNSRSAMVTGNLTAYKIILNELSLPDAAYTVPSKNMLHSDSRLVCNTVLEKYDVQIDKSCIHLIADLVGVECKEDGKIDKSNKDMGHLLDAFRYASHYFTKAIINKNY